jgi:single-stranded-DNA-specific exonuclease
LNAAGRLDSALLALSLFEERDAGRAAQAARALSLRNADRQALERRVVAQARERIEADSDPGSAALIVEVDAGWHRGVLGIAASRLAREFHRPVLLFGLDGEKASGSGRSIPGVSLHGLLMQLRHHFIDFGGHGQAVGASLPMARFAEFRSQARALFSSQVPPEALTWHPEAETELPLESVQDDLVEELLRLEPHGAGNPRPTFLARGVRAAGPMTSVGPGGLRGRLRRSGSDLPCIAWDPGEHLAKLASGGSPFEILYRVAGPRRGWGLQVEILAARPQERAA